jgi:pimeloyl-ACP methyl ester carboxylesterase
MAAKQNLVLVPGLLCTEALWAPQMAALSDVADMTVADHASHDTMDGIAAAILAKAPERFALAGLSMGGYVALAVTLKAPERVTRLALLDTGSRADTPERKEARLKRNELARQKGAVAVQDELMSVLIHPDRLSDKPLVDAVRQMAVDIGTDGLIRQHAALMGRPDSRPLLGQIRCPTLVLAGREDVLTPLELSQEIVAGIPGARLEIIPHCGHLSTMERPEAINKVLRAWLSW